MKSFIDKYSTYIGIGLIVIALVGGILLFIKKGANADLSTTQSSPAPSASPAVSVVSATVSTTLSPSPSPSATPTVPAGKININTADATQLDSLPGIGPVYAQRIIDYRTAHGRFTSTSQIQNVKGIGPKTYAKFKDLITI